MKPDAADNSVPREISALLSNERLILRETQRAVTPLGGVAVFVAFLHKLGFVEKLRQHMPIQLKSPNHIDPTATFTAFLIAVLAGARRFAHANWLRGDRVCVASSSSAGCAAGWKTTRLSSSNRVRSKSQRPNPSSPTNFASCWMLAMFRTLGSGDATTSIVRIGCVPSCCSPDGLASL